MSIRDQVVKEAKLTQTQGRVLRYLYEIYSGRPLDLSYAMSAVTLMERGLVSYAWEPSGGKRWFLTAEGREVLDQINERTMVLLREKREAE